jgi:hypothetical protein
MNPSHPQDKEVKKTNQQGGGVTANCLLTDDLTVFVAGSLPGFGSGFPSA